MIAVYVISGWLAVAVALGLALGRAFRWADTAPPSSRLLSFAGIDEQ